MSHHSNIPDDLAPGTEPELIALAEHLLEHRPLPSPLFRGRLGRHLAARAAGGRSPARLRALIAGYASAGSAMLVVGAASAAGLGPLG